MFRVLLFGFLLALQLGCSESAQVSTRQSSEQNFQLGHEAFERNDYEGAAIKLDEALRQKGLNADLAAEALFMRAKSCIKLGRVTEAMQDLEDASNGPIAMDEILLAKAEVARLQEDGPRAKELVQEARKLNPAIKIPEKLLK